MSALHQRISEWLGVDPAHTEQDLRDIVKRQLPPSAINRLLALGLTRADIDELVIPLRTLQHRRSRREKLSVEESNRVLRLMRALSQAENVYGTRERALAWLRRPNAQLAGQSPLSLLDTDSGIRIVDELLVQIDEGMFV